MLSFSNNYFVDHFFCWLDERLFVGRKWLYYRVVVEDDFVLFGVHAVADCSFDVWYLVKPIINVLDKTLSNSPTKNKHNSYSLFNSLNRLLLIIKLHNFPIGHLVRMFKLICTIIKLINIITDTNNGCLFNWWI